MTKLPRTDADLFHHFLAYLLYLSKGTRPYIQRPASLLCTRVRAPDVDDYKKLKSVRKYIQVTIGLPLILPMEKSLNIKWYVGATFDVHKDMRNCTGGFMNMITGGFYVQYKKN